MPKDKMKISFGDKFITIISGVVRLRHPAPHKAKLVSVAVRPVGDRRDTE